MVTPRTKNPHCGSNFDDLLKEDGIYEAVQARAIKRTLAEQLDDAAIRHPCLFHVSVALNKLDMRQ